MTVMDKLEQAKLVTAAAVLSAVPTVAAMAQAADPLGVQAAASPAIAAIKVICGLGVVWGFFRLMSGRHTLEGLVTIAVGALGVGKASTIATLLGVSGGS